VAIDQRQSAGSTTDLERRADGITVGTACKSASGLSIAAM